jgi:uncharacterized protein (DUF2141 family)
VVISQDAEPKRLRRARVTLNAPELDVGRTTITADDGTFVFDRLPAGRYTVGAAKEGYIALNFGATRPTNPGTPMPLTDGEQRTLTIRIPRGGAITGIVTDPDGHSAPGIVVNALTTRYVGAISERRLVPAGTSVSLTDDRGVYRIFGLPAGEYVVAAQLRGSPGPAEFQTVSPSEVRRALAEARQAAGSTKPGISGPGAPATNSTLSIEAGRPMAFAPVFYPGATSASQAQMLTLGIGEERTGIDFPLEYVPLAKVQGSVYLPGNVRSAFVRLAPENPDLPFERSFRRSVGADGRFTFDSVPPGRYTLMVWAAVSEAVPDSRPRPLIDVWATTELVVSGHDVTDIALTPQPSMTVSGRVLFEGPRPQPAILSLLSGRTLPLSHASGAGMPPVLQIDSDGQFNVRGIIPGGYGSMLPTGVRTPIGSWWLKSLTIDGRELLDAPLDIRQNAEGAVAVFSDNPSQLTGRVADSSGHPAPSYFVIVFGADRTSWFLNSRRVTGARPDAQGLYTIRNLPAGEYFITATSDIDPGEWFDTRVLDKFSRGAGRITLADGERKTHNLTVQAR